MRTCVVSFAVIALVGCSNGSIGGDADGGDQTGGSGGTATDGSGDFPDSRMSDAPTDKGGVERGPDTSIDANTSDKNGAERGPDTGIDANTGDKNGAERGPDTGIDANTGDSSSPDTGTDANADVSPDSPSFEAFPDTTTPTLSLDRVIRTSPFSGTSLSMKDNEGSAFVPNDSIHPNKDGTDSLWVVDDGTRSAWEVNPYNGALKARITETEWQATKQYDSITKTGTGASAGNTRERDFESLSYDRDNDLLYAFSGKCCVPTVQPTVFRLKRASDGAFHPESWQALPLDSDFTATAWNSGDGKLYAGVKSNIRTYDYATNTAGTTFKITGVSGIEGFAFSQDGAHLFIAASKTGLLRVDWAAKELSAGWTLDLASFGVLDARGIELIGGQIYISDGADTRPTDPVAHGIFVFNVGP